MYSASIRRKLICSFHIVDVLLFQIQCNNIYLIPCMLRLLLVNNAHDVVILLE